jgi:hypothetical protein
MSHGPGHWRSPRSLNNGNDYFSKKQFEFASIPLVKKIGIQNYEMHELSRAGKNRNDEPKYLDKIGGPIDTLALESLESNSRFSTM